MATHRFFTDPKNMSNGKITLSGEDSRHINVLRVGANESFIICDGLGTDYICKLAALSRETAVCDIIYSEANQSEPDIRTVLFQGLPKADKMELIIQKSVELGVSEIVPVVTANTVAKPTENTHKKTERYNKISEAAAKQCGRGIIPRVHEPVSFTEAIAILAGMDESYIAYEREQTRMLRDAYDTGRSGKSCGFFIGPEGGFSDEEARICERNAIMPVSLGKRILRTETAGFVMLATYYYARGRL